MTISKTSLFCLIPHMGSKGLAITIHHIITKRMYYNGETRNYNDLKNLHNGLIGKIFYELDPNNKNRFRTIRVAWNAMANKLQLQYSNEGAFIEGTPPDGMKAFNPRLRTSINTMQPYMGTHY